MLNLAKAEPEMSHDSSWHLFATRVHSYFFKSSNYTSHVFIQELVWISNSNVYQRNWLVHLSALNMKHQ